MMTPFIGYCQSVKEKLNRLSDVTEVPYACEGTGESTKSDTIIYNIGCGDKIFWDVVRCKLDAVPGLINKLSDTTQTKAAVPYFGGQYTVADVAYVALSEIIDGIPTFKLLGTTFDTTGCCYCSYWNYLRSNLKNRNNFRESVFRWYVKNRTKLVWVKSDEVLTFDVCAFRHPNAGHFEVR